MSRTKIQSSKFKIQDSRFKIQDSRLNVQGSKFKVQSSKLSRAGDFYSIMLNIVLKCGYGICAGLCSAYC